MELDPEERFDLNLLEYQEGDDVIWTHNDRSRLSLATSSIYDMNRLPNFQKDASPRATASDIATLIHEAIKAAVYPAFARNSDMKICKESNTTALADLFPSVWRPGFLKVGIPSTAVIMLQVLMSPSTRK